MAMRWPEAQRRGVAEADPSLDVDGWDTANKLLIIANSLLGADIALADIAVTGIAGVTAGADRGRGGPRERHTAGRQRRGRAVCRGAGRPSRRRLPGPVQGLGDGGRDAHRHLRHQLPQLREREPTPTAASMLRDAVHIFAAAGRG